jgi:hypothetical protein
MAVCANELALFDLLQQPNPAHAVDAPDIGLLLESRKVVPVHCGGVVDASTIGAGAPSLQAYIPLGRLPSSTSNMFKSTGAVSPVVLGHVLALALLAPWLMSVSPLMKVG